MIFFAESAEFADRDKPMDFEAIQAMESANWQVATDPAIAETIKRIEHVETRPKNEWDLPFIMAMKLDPPPKRIDFLTDGEKKDAMLLAGAIIKLIKRVDEDIRVNTVAMMAPRSSPPLFRIAKATGGSHALVLPDRTIRDEQELREFLYTEKGIQLEKELEHTLDTTQTAKAE